MFAWQPAAHQGGKSYRLTFIVTDDGTPRLSASQSIDIVVRDTRTDFVLRLGTTNVFASGSGTVPLSLDASADLSQISFDLTTTDAHFTALGLSASSDEIAQTTFEPAGEGIYRTRIEFDNARLQSGVREIGKLHFDTEATDAHRSAFWTSRR